MHRPGSRTNQSGFTLIEMLMVVAIVAVLAGIAMPLAELSARRAKEQQLRASLREIRNALDAYKRASDQGRVSRQADESGYPPTLQILVDGAIDMKDPQRRRLYFLRKVPRDPFAPAEAPTSGGYAWRLRSYESPPDDPKEGRDVFDVYSSSAQTGINGIPYRQW